MVGSLSRATAPLLVTGALHLFSGGAHAGAEPLPAPLAEALAAIEADPVRANPAAIEAVLDQCRAGGHGLCEARALLARAECFAEAGLPPSVVTDAAGAESILRSEGGREGDLARALLLMRGSGAGGGEAAAAKGRERYAEGIALARRAGDLSTEGRIHCEWAKLESTVQDFGAFKGHLDAAAAIADRGRLPRVAACVAYRRGLAKYGQRDTPGARKIWDAFAESDLADEAPRELLWILVGSAAVSIDLTDPEPALRHARRARELGEAIQGEGDQVPAYCNLSTASFLMGYIGESEETARICLDLGGKAGRRDTEALGTLRLGSVAYARGELTKAEELTQRALALSREIQFWPQVPWCLLTLGDILVDAGRASEAARHLEEAMGMADRFGPPSQQAIMRSSLSLALSGSGDLERAEALAEEAIDLVEDSDADHLLAAALRARGAARYRMADYEPALSDYIQAGEIHQKAGRSADTARVAIDIGNTWYQTNRLDFALEEYSRAYRLAKKAGAGQPLSVAAGNIAMLRRRFASSEHERRQLIEFVREAAEHSQGQSQVIHLVNLSKDLDRAGRLEEAEEQARRALSSSLRMQVIDLEANSRTRLALVLAGMNRHDEALGECRQVLSGTVPMTPDMEMRALFRCGAVQRMAGEDGLAVETHRAAVRKAESLGDQLRRQELRASFIEDRVGFYVELIWALMNRAGGTPSPVDMEEMFEISEGFRARMLLESLSPGRSGPEGSQGIQRVGLSELQQRLPGNTAALEYIFGQGASFLFAVTRDDARVVQLPGIEVLWEPVRVFRGLLERRGRDPERDLQAIRAQGATLYEVLLAPVSDLLGGEIGKLVISPEGPLHFLPFETLVAPGNGGDMDGRFLAERFEISLVPSMSVLSHLQRRSGFHGNGHTLAAFANPAMRGLSDAPASRAAHGPARSSVFRDLPPLPFSENEVRRIARLLGGTREIHIGREVGEETLTAALEGGHSIVHVATHGFLDSTSFGRSGLILSPGRDDDGILEAREVMDLDVNAGLVVLSGCTTGGGRLVRGEGFIGLPHALFQAGARSIITSLWAVGDRSAALFMERFYESLGRGLEVGAAMRETKLSLIRSGRAELAHPSAWAPFVVSGLSDPGLDLPPPERISRAAWMWVILLAGLLASVAAFLISRRRSPSS